MTRCHSIAIEYYGGVVMIIDRAVRVTSVVRIRIGLGAERGSKIVRIHRSGVRVVLRHKGFTVLDRWHSGSITLSQLLDQFLVDFLHVQHLGLEVGEILLQVVESKNALISLWLEPLTFSNVNKHNAIHKPTLPCFPG